MESHSAKSKVYDIYLRILSSYTPYAHISSDGTKIIDTWEKSGRDPILFWVSLSNSDKLLFMLQLGKGSHCVEKLDIMSHSYYKLCYLVHYSPNSIIDFLHRFFPDFHVEYLKNKINAANNNTIILLQSFDQYVRSILLDDINIDKMLMHNLKVNTNDNIARIVDKMI